MKRLPPIYASYAPPVRDKLATLRQLILETAAQTEGAGEIVETLKWGQPSFLTERPKSGSTIRIDQHGDNGDVAMYFICHTHLVSRFRDLYADRLTLEGDRAIIIDDLNATDLDALRHCIAMALTYHLGERKQV